MGERGFDKTEFVVKDGQYWWPVATISGNEVTLTALGEKVLQKEEKPAEVVAPRKAKRSAVPDIDSLDG
jgi:hypothetical protein